MEKTLPKLKKIIIDSLFALLNAGVLKIRHVQRTEIIVVQKSHYIFDFANGVLLIDTDDISTKTDLPGDVLPVGKKPEINAFFVVGVLTIVLVHFENQTGRVSEQQRVVDQS